MEICVTFEFEDGVNKDTGLEQICRVTSSFFRHRKSLTCYINYVFSQGSAEKGTNYSHIAKSLIKLCMCSQ